MLTALVDSSEHARELLNSTPVGTIVSCFGMQSLLSLALVFGANVASPHSPASTPHIVVRRRYRYRRRLHCLPS